MIVEDLDLDDCGLEILPQRVIKSIPEIRRGYHVDSRTKSSNTNPNRRRRDI
jgi:hypothetical protein